VKKPLWGAAVALVLVAFSPLYATAREPAQARSGGLGRYIVVLKNDVAHPGTVAARHERILNAETTHVYSSALKGYAAKMSAGAALSLAGNPNVAWVEKDRPMSIAAQVRPTGIRRIAADRSPTANINGVDNRVKVDVAVIDSGIDTEHADLNVVGGRNCSTGQSFDDGNGHGTHVAGTIGAKDNGIGVVGVAPGARLHAVRVLNNSGSGSTSTVACGLDWVAANASKIEVANMSLGGEGSDDGNCGRSNNDVEHRAICNAVSKGVTFAVAAGNSHENTFRYVPAAYDEVITVSALADFNGAPGGGARATCRDDVDDTFANFSNFGADVDLIAPGVCINSTWTGNGYKRISGTSMASPHAAGAAALYAANHPAAGPATVKSALQNAGTLNWTWPSQDGDNIKEKLVNVARF
jgi:subtilisin